MSSSLVIKPVEIPPLVFLPDELKFAIKSRLNFPLKVTIQSLEYFKGLEDAGIPGASIVIEYVEKYGEVSLEETW